jgi:pimeloyl-ACP methyl ester carboxylesterase
MNLAHFSIKTSGLTLTGLKNQGGSGRPIIALHGWLDNAASFLPLCDHLASERPFYAVEMPGHGLSDHRARSSTYHLVDNVVDIAAFIAVVLDAHYIETGVKETQVTLLGHSLGGIVCSFLAAASPDLIDKLILLDSLGPLTDDIENVLPQLRKAVAKASLFSNSKMTIYPDIDKAIKVRMIGVGKVTHAAAALLVDRGIKKVDNGYCWTSDPKLLNPSMVRFTEAQVKEVFAGISCRVYLVCGDQGYFSDYQLVSERLSYIKCLNKFIVEGGHHFHMDGDVRQAALIIDNALNE